MRMGFSWTSGTKFRWHQLLGHELEFGRPTQVTAARDLCDLLVELEEPLSLVELVDCVGVLPPTDAADALATFKRGAFATVEESGDAG